MDDITTGIQPRPSLGRRLDVTARRAFPAITTFLLLLLATAPLNLPGQAQLQPAVLICAVFFWSLFRPASLPPPLVFVLGLLADLIGLMPPGVMIFTLLAVQAVVLRGRRVLARQGFLLVWAALIVLAGAVALIGWGLASVLLWQVLPTGPALFQWALTVALYPLLAALFTRAHRTLAAPERA